MKLWPGKSLLNSEQGIAAIEYALIAAIIAIAAVMALGAIGNSLSGTFGKVSTVLDLGGAGGTGVGVGGGAYSGRPSVFPVTVAYWPHSQQVPEPLGLLMIQ